MKQQEANDTLINAAILGKLEQAQDAIANGANVNVISSDGVTPLFYAVERNYPEVIRLLIEKGANVNADDGLGSTPLHSAAATGNRDIAKILIDAGADITLKNWKNRTASDSAAFGPDPGMAGWLSEPRRAKPISRTQQEANDTLINAAILGKLEQAQDAIAKGANVNVISSDGVTPLFYAVERSNPEVIRLLIEKGANVNADDGLGSTPLHSAAVTGNRDIAKLLIDAGADITLKNWKNRTASDSAAFGPDPGMAGLFEGMAQKRNHATRIRQSRCDTTSLIKK